MALVKFFCPHHGFIMGAPEHSLVECHCGKDATPLGLSAQAHRRWYFKQQDNSQPDRATLQRRRARERREAARA